MAMHERRTVVGVFEDAERAREAVHELKRMGFSDADIGIVAHDKDRREGTTKEGEGSYLEEGAVTGLAAGAGVGALWGLGIVAGFLPAIGPAIAGGILGTLLSSAAAGAAAAGIAGALIGFGIPEEEAQYYEGEFKSGRTLVTVKTDGRYDEVYNTLRRFGAYDINTRGMAAATSTGTSGVASGMRTGEAERTMELREEELRARKHEVETGEVAVHKEVHTEHRTLEVPVTKEEVVVERRPATGERVSDTGIREGEEIRIPVTEEQVTVEKQPVVKEEVTVGKRKVQDTEQVSGTVRKEEVRVEEHGDVDVKRDK